MELVYLWVKKYKNIEEQGFNFSSKFYCEYNEEEKKLTINKNDDYIPDFFGENINVTAIVGKNGSGKSSVLEYLSDSPKFVVTFENDEFYFNEDIEVINNSKYKYIKNKIDLDYVYIQSPDNFINTQENLNSRYTNNTFLYNFSDDNKESTELIFRQINTFINSKNSLKTVVFPKNIVFVFLVEMFVSMKNGEHIRLAIDDIKHISLSELVYLVVLRRFLYLNITFFEDTTFTTYMELTSLYFLNDIKDKSSKIIFLDFEKELKSSELKKKFNDLKDYCSLFDSYIDIYTTGEFILDVPTAQLQQIEISFCIPLKKISKQVIRYGDYEVDYSLFWDIKLSSGEQSFINILSAVYYYLSEEKMIDYIYIDEGESFLHPNWQKKYISYIVQFIKDNFPNRKIHIILTSHSPFLLSDIPKQNIIFLDKDENGNCKVVDGLKEKKQTFGANIHTLLSDSFFMEDGLMGEFAKSKIDDVINYLHDRESKIKSDDEAQKLIHIIGEPIVKNQLQRMLDSKRLKKVDEIDAIKKSMIAMKQRLDELEK